MKIRKCDLCGRENWLMFHRPDLDPEGGPPELSNFELCGTCNKLIDIERQIIENEMDKEYGRRVDKWMHELANEVEIWSKA